MYGKKWKKVQLYVWYSLQRDNVSAFAFEDTDGEWRQPLQVRASLHFTLWLEWSTSFQAPLVPSSFSEASLV